MKTLFLYWGGQPLSWLRYLTVVSFAKHNPSWKIKVYYPVTPTKGNTWPTTEQDVEYTGKDWFKKLSKYAELVPLDMEELGFSNDLAEVHKSGVFRAWAIHNFGGVYSDMDILYSKPFPKVKERMYSRHPETGHYSDGLLAGLQGDELFKELLEDMHEANVSNYQSFGPTLWRRRFKQNPDGWNIPTNLVYSCYWQDAPKLFTEQNPLPKDAIGIHWFGGNHVPGEWENILTPENHDYKSTICDLIKDVV